MSLENRHPLSHTAANTIITAVPDHRRADFVRVIGRAIVVAFVRLLNFGNNIEMRITWLLYR